MIALVGRRIDSLSFIKNPRAADHFSHSRSHALACSK